jgi:hypothetical protein
MNAAWTRWLSLVWVVIGVCTVALFIPSLVEAHHYLVVPCAGSHCFEDQISPRAARALSREGFSVTFYGNYYTALAGVFAAVWTLLGLVLVLRKPLDPLAAFSAMSFVGFGCSLLGVMNAPTVAGERWSLLAKALNETGFLSLFILLYIFPSGRFVPTWTRWLAIVMVVLVESPIIFTHTALNTDNWPGPLSLLPFATIVFSSVFAQVYRYRRVSGPIERQQTKWVVFGVAVSLISFFGVVIIQILVPAFNETGSLLWMVTLTVAILLFLLIPLSVAVAILRYRLWDIDVLINRALVYGSLSVSTAGVYIGGVIALQALFRSVTGQTSDLAIAIATLAVAALFNPWRRRLQSFIDRRFYRRRYDAARTLAAMSTRLRDDVDLDQLASDLTRVVHETIQPAHVSLWLPHESAR